ncbi:putative membrane protein [Rubidibacter lacunae KORDI 51-2]|uniref:Putative membrane protein n=1 Tax=Rubidibacter lacunae KORDI 51-2 TaxID=582515 RepID=U5DC87_9CHRO|nr:rhomboid family intramembrane serine protease [Rubidibacter lacunae]ERN42143.1 putative membrane protein [Rubidibacter lacunae KORDI 51-2]
MIRQDNEQAIVRKFRTQVTILASFVGSFWAIEFLDRGLLGNTLHWFGIVPRDPVGLRGILFAPFLHGSVNHLLSNTVPFVMLGWLVMLRATHHFWIVTGLSMLVGGTGVWLFGAPQSIHLGASILIFGYLGFLVLYGYFQRDASSVALSLIVVLLYGSAVWGILPLQGGISWEGHLFGLLGGALAAWLLSGRARARRNN